MATYNVQLIPEWNQVTRDWSPDQFRQFIQYCWATNQHPKLTMARKFKRDNFP